MQLSIYDKKTMLEVSDMVFAKPANEGLVHQVATAYLAAGRAGTVAQKTRAEVTASGRKPWKQKGTGNARAGTVASPLWRSGGVTFAAKPRSYCQKVNKKMYRGALRVIFSELLRQQRLLVVEEFAIEQPKTKLFVAALDKLSVTTGLVITHHVEDDTSYRHLCLASANIPNVKVVSARDVNPIDLLTAKQVLMTVDAVKYIEESLA